jgi:hypothetical protein
MRSSPSSFGAPRSLPSLQSAVELSSILMLGDATDPDGVLYLRSRVPCVKCMTHTTGQ